MAISPVRSVGVSSEPAPGGADRRSPSRTARAGSAATPAEGHAADRVFLSETARRLAKALTKDEPQLHLSPAELRAMIEPKSESILQSPRTRDDGSSHAEERHVR